MYLSNKEEIQATLVLCQEFLQESRYSAETLSTTKCLRILETVSKKPETFFFEFQKDSHGNIVAMFIGYIEYLFFAEVKQARDLIFYVHPEHRGSSWFIKTLKQLEQWSKERDAKYIEIVHNTGINTGKSQDLFKRLGYTLTGHVFNKEL